MGRAWSTREPGQAVTPEPWKYSAAQWEEAINEHNHARGFYRHVDLAPHSP
jgi:hypothetical protein